MNRAARLFPLGLMLGMALLSFWLNVLTMQDNGAPGQPDLKTPEYTISQVRAKRFDITGKLQQEMQASQMWQLPKNPNVYLSQPKIMAYHENTLDYTVTANNGRYQKDLKTADLSDNVHWDKPATASEAAVQLQTSIMHIDSVARQASNKAPLQASFGNNKLWSTGFIYQQDSGKLDLLSNVRISYAP